MTILSPFEKDKFLDLSSKDGFTVEGVHEMLLGKDFCEGPEGSEDSPEKGGGC